MTEPVAPVEELVSSFLYPPFATPPASVGAAYQCDDPVSWLLSVPETGLSVIREQTVDGAHLVVLRHLKKYSADAFKDAAYAGKIELGDITTIWVDRDRNCLPVKIERRTEWFYNGSQVGEKDHTPSLDRVFKLPELIKNATTPPLGLSNQGGRSRSDERALSQ